MKRFFLTALANALEAAGLVFPSLVRIRAEQRRVQAGPRK